MSEIAAFEQGGLAGNESELDTQCRPDHEANIVSERGSHGTFFWKNVRKLVSTALTISVAVTGAAFVEASVSPPNAYANNPTNTRLDPSGTVELSGSSWLNGEGVNVYSNGNNVENDAGNEYVNGVLSGEEWQCVELVNRLYLTRGWISSNWYGNGDGLYANAPSNLTKQPEGSITGMAPGDVISLGDQTTGTGDDDGGHAAVVGSVSGDTINIINQNTPDVYSTATFNPAAGTLAMNGWAGYYPIGVIDAPTSSGSDGLDNLSFINTDYYDGGAQEVTYTEASGYQSILSNVVTGYPSTTANGSIFPLYKPNGDLSFINTDYYTGHAQDVTYSASSNYQTMVANVVTPYPSTTPNGSIIPLYKPNGDLSFINLNYYGGHVQDVTYSASSGYQSLGSNIVTPYPDVPGNGLVIPKYEPNGDLAFINTDYWGGDTQVVSYSAASGYESLASNIETPYPDVTTPGLVAPLFHSNGDLSFVNINYDGGDAQVVTYDASSNFQTLSSNILTAYPDTTPDDTIFPMYQPNGS